MQTSFIHKDQDRSGSFATGASANSSDALNTFRINGNYYYRSEKCGAFGGSVGYFRTTGSTDTSLYAPAPATGSNNGSPDSKGVILEFDYLPPWKYVYTKLSGNISYTTSLTARAQTTTGLAETLRITTPCTFCYGLHSNVEGKTCLIRSMNFLLESAMAFP